jgi:outer membrane protein TolC
LPGEDFPSPPGKQPTTGVGDEAFVLGSLNRRADYQSSLKMEQANDTLLVAARNNVKPQLDFSLQAGYTAVDQGSEYWRFFSAADPWASPGANVLGSLRLTFPIGNRAAKGLLAQRSAALEQATLRSQDLARTITSAVRTSLAQLHSAILEWGRLELSFKNYQAAVTNEAEKMKLGNSTVLDQITIADRWTNMRLKQIQVKARYATAVVRVRYESGLLVSALTPTPAIIYSADLMTAPVLSGGNPSPTPTP